MSMLATPAIAIPIDDSGDFSDSGSISFESSPPKFPHTRAQLSAIAREYRPSPDSYDSDADGEEPLRIDSALLYKVVGFLEEEDEDGLKALLKNNYGMDDESLEQHVLDLMHKHRDDIAGVPFLFLTPTRRPISRPSSRASSHSFRLTRPDTPNSAPSSPLAQGFRRPHTPAASPLAYQAQATSYMTARGESPVPSPVLAHAQAIQTHAQFTASLPSSPVSSPRILNAKASEFRPTPRPLSAASSNPGSFSSLRAETPSPDLWSHNTSRPSSNLAIAAPLIPDSTRLPRALTPNSSLRSSHSRHDDDNSNDNDDDDDPFDPFATKSIPRSFPGNVAPMNALDFDAQWSNSSNSASSLSTEEPNSYNTSLFHHPYELDQPLPQEQSADDGGDVDPDTTAMLTDGMTPFDVLSSVFGTTLAPSELEEALANNGYDFESAMAWLVDRALPVPPQRHVTSQSRPQQMGGRVVVVPREQASLIRGGRAGYGSIPGDRSGSRYVNGRPGGGNRVCRYFLAGECLRADCRFSHDLERAMCRFWLRGTCAKQENCEFLHHLPKDVDVSGLTAAILHTDMGDESPSGTPPPDDFPVLGTDSAYVARGRGGAYGQNRGGTYHDPGRTRFAAAVKRMPPPAAPQLQSPPASQSLSQSLAAVKARREAMGTLGESLHHRTAIVAPRASPRIKLRPPLLLPTLPTGESVNALYMAYRSRALQLGAARNACLSRAADAWRRGDGAAAKRFSREGHDLNAKMSAEAAEAAGKLVRERATLAEQAVRSRDANWSDDPGDRTSRGKTCGGGLGVCLGVASMTVLAEGNKTTPEERTECALDLHGLHSNEATDVLEDFLLELEREHFYGLAYIVVGEEKHTGTQDVVRGASRARLATGVREWLHHWGYPWSERDGIICVDALTHSQ